MNEHDNPIANTPSNDSPQSIVRNYSVTLGSDDIISVRAENFLLVEGWVMFRAGGGLVAGFAPRTVHYVTSAESDLADQQGGSEEKGFTHALRD